MEKAEIIELIREAIKENLSIKVDTDFNWLTNNVTVRVEVSYGEEVIATSDDYFSMSS